MILNYTHLLKKMSIFPHKPISLDFADTYSTLKSSDESRELFKNCKDIQEFNKLMYLVVNNKIHSPFYNFDNEISGDCNGWWLDSDPRYTLLKEMNRVNLITIEAQEDICVYCNEPEKKVCDDNKLDILNADHFNCKNANAGEICFWLNVKYVKNLLEFVKNDKEIKIIYHGFDLEAEVIDPCKHLCYFENYLNPDVEKEIASQLVDIGLEDTVKGRRVHAEDGLFTKVVKFLNQL